MTQYHEIWTQKTSYIVLLGEKKIKLKSWFVYAQHRFFLYQMKLKTLYISKPPENTDISKPLKIQKNRLKSSGKRGKSISTQHIETGKVGVGGRGSDYVAVVARHGDNAWPRQTFPFLVDSTNFVARARTTRNFGFLQVKTVSLVEFGVRGWNWQLPAAALTNDDVGDNGIERDYHERFVSRVCPVKFIQKSFGFSHPLGIDIVFTMVMTLTSRCYLRFPHQVLLKEYSWKSRFHLLSNFSLIFNVGWISFLKFLLTQQLLRRRK